MFDITDRRVVQLDRIYSTYQDSLNIFRLQPPSWSAMGWLMLSFIVAAIGAYLATTMDVHSLFTPMAPFFVAAAVGIVRYATFPYKRWNDSLNSLLSEYDPSDQTAFALFEGRVGLHGFVAEDVIDWVCAERTSIANAEQAARAKAIVQRIVND